MGLANSAVEAAPAPRWPALFTPFQVKSLRLKNRVMSTSHAPGYAVAGKPLEQYIAYHEEKAKGGLALTSFGGSSSVSIDSPAAQWRQISLADDSIIPVFQAFAERIHRHDTALMCQVSHLGHRSRYDAENWLAPIAPSPVREPAHRSFPRQMDRDDIARVQADFAEAVRRCRDGGLDGVELIASGAHLIGQFFSPHTNRRTDGYGGSVRNRVRFGIEVLEAVRRAVGDDFAVGLRLSSDEMSPEALNHQQCLEIAAAFAASGVVDFLTVSTATNASSLGLARSIPGMWQTPHPYVALAGDVKRETGLPVFHAGRVLDLDQAEAAVSAGHLDMVGMTRAHIADPHLVRKALDGRHAEIRPCVGANYCVERLHLGGMSLCIHNVATGREQMIPQAITAPAETPLRVVIAGGGPAGLEAARVSAERGHHVVLLEAGDRLGGQLRIAERAPWRAQMGVIADWLAARVKALGVDVRLGVKADANAILALAPDVVIVATGGYANPGDFEGAELAVTASDILAGHVEPAQEVLLFDDNGYNQGLSAAETILGSGARLLIATPERALGAEMTASNYAIHLRNIYGKGGTIRPDTRLVRLERHAASNRLAATLRNEMTHDQETLVFDQVVVETGTLPNDDLFEALRAVSGNGGALDWDAYVALRPQPRPAEGFSLFRIGDAVASRDVHASMYDAMRLTLPIGSKSSPQATKEHTQ
ncbi:NADH:flavin oxidoreductase [Aureimonas sp. OT7]|uniref:NADH:flavin oxidoreductase n=1 Tax=Aureimonas sp. OT7 TaxID=2816454 RepID=UPI001780C0C0|nr:NADH:flavin oxidoreductase [Aureimonas sp. OT7]QOG06429.1 NADH:flavin oxidoreductase [Aureimonas sp. OT7]